jgi:carbamoyl-phosphate synthase large subunit
VVTKIPRFAFEKFAGADPRLTTQMKSVGEAMAIGRTFKESVQKAARSLETGRDGLTSLLSKVNYRDLAAQVRRLVETGESINTAKPMLADLPEPTAEDLQEAILDLVRTPLADRLWYVADGFRVGLTIDAIHDATDIDVWFLEQIRQIVAFERALKASGGHPLSESLLREAKQLGFSDRQIAALRGERADKIRMQRAACSVEPVYARVDTCAAEFPALTPYMYSTWGLRSEARAKDDKKKVMILGGGPNRIGQGIEFDYCCVHASFALKEMGFETIMVNCNPETVSTDYDTSDKLYFEPLTFEDVMHIVEVEKPDGVIVQFGGQTPLKLAVPLSRAGVPILGTSADAIDRAEDRERFDELLTKLRLNRPRGGIAKGTKDAFAVADKIGFPVVVRPSYVLGGRAMEIVHSPEDLSQYMTTALEAVSDAETQTILVDEFLKDAIEVDVDCISDGKDVVIGGLLQHIEEAGIHSGDSSMVLPAHALPPGVLATLRSSTHALALELGVVGLMNVQFAVRGDAVFVIEVNPRASRTIPFISKAIGVPLAKIAAMVMAGATLREIGYTREIVANHVAVKESVFPFTKFPGVDTLLTPEMRSTGEVMGIADSFPDAFYKALLSAHSVLPDSGKVFISVKERDKPVAAELARRLKDLGFEIIATSGTRRVLERAGVEAAHVHKVGEGRPHIVDLLQNGEIALVFNTTEGAKTIRDSRSMRRQTVLSDVPYFTTMAAAVAAVDAVEARRRRPPSVCSLQEYHARTSELATLRPPSR